MRHPGALRRRLDPWAVMLLGALIALGVIILLATPGPWHKVVPVTPRVPAGPPPPRDVLVLVTRSADDPRCVGALWVHVGYETREVAVVVVPARLTGFLAGAGMIPLAEVVAHGGPAAGANAAGEALGVTFDGWISVTRAAVGDMVPLVDRDSEPKAAYRRSGRAWSGSGSIPWALSVQMSDVGRYAAEWRPRFFNRAAFVNFILGSDDASTGMKLQAASALADAIHATPRGDITAGALPVVVYGRGAYERVRPDHAALVVYRSTFTSESDPVGVGVRVERVTASDRILVLSDAVEGSRRRFARAFEQVVQAYAGRDVQVVDVFCRDEASAAAAVAASASGRPSLAVVATFGRAGAGSPATAPGLLDAVAAASRRVCLPLVIAVPDPGDATAREVLLRTAGESGFPWVASSVESDAATVAAAPAAVEKQLGVAAGECLVRAVTPRFFAPGLRATQVGFDYYDRGSLELAVAGADAGRVAQTLDRLAVMGYRASPVDVDPDAGAEGVAGGRLAMVRYREGERSAALCLADDLGWSRLRVIVDQGAPAPVTVMLATR